MLLSWTGLKFCRLGKVKIEIGQREVISSLTLYHTDKKFGCPNSKHFADEKFIVSQNMKFVFHRVENIVGKGGNAGYQHFLPFPQVFLRSQHFAVKV